MRSLLFLALAACTEHGSSVADAPGDSGPPPPPLPDAFDPCTNGDVFLTGELVDFDSSGAAFMGVFGAQLSVAGTVLHTTPPNGRLDSCVPPADPLRLDVDAPDGFLDGSMIVPQDTLHSLRPLSFRGITSARATTFYAERGLAFDATKAHVLVFLAGDSSPLSLDRPHGTTQAGDDGGHPGTFAWSAGDTGRYVLFPNVDVSSPTGVVSGGMRGPISVPLAAGKLTLVAVSIIFI